MKEPVVREDNRSHASGNCPSGSGSAGRPDVNQRTKVALLTVSFSGFEALRRQWRKQQGERTMSKGGCPGREAADRRPLRIEGATETFPSPEAGDTRRAP